MKKKKILQRAVTYYRSHMWCSLLVSIFGMIFIIALILLGYMKSKYYQYLLDTTYESEKVMIESVNKIIENQMESFIDLGANIAVDERLVQEIENYVQAGKTNQYASKLMRTTLKSTTYGSGSITGVAVVEEDGLLAQFSREEVGIEKVKGIWDENDQYEIVNLFQEMKKHNETGILPRYIIVNGANEHLNVSGRGVLHIAFPIKNGYNYKHMKYMIIVSYYSQPISALLKQLSQGGKDEFLQGYIENASGKILFHTDENYVDKNAKKIYNSDTNKINLETDVENYGWKLHGVIDKAALEANINKMYSKAMILYLCAILAVMGIAILIIKSILKPVSVISTSIDRVKTGDMQGYISIEGTNEIWQLAREYNEMLCSIQEANVKVEEQHGEIIESMKMKRRAEREALESQINAHFICNTLNAINYEAMDNGDFKVSLLLKKLSNILRYTFDQKHQNVYMFQEISWIEQYLFLQKERMGSAFDYEIQFDSDYDNWPCRKLMLQPFVENSILHGLEGVNKGGFIRITGEGYQEYLKIVIEDNGCGMTPEVEQIIKEVLENPLLAKQKGLGIGISNVVTRMRMYYTEDLKIQLETEERKGCKFTMILPEARQ